MVVSAVSKFLTLGSAPAKRRASITSTEALLTLKRKIKMEEEEEKEEEEKEKGEKRRNRGSRWGLGLVNK